MIETFEPYVAYAAAIERQAPDPDGCRFPHCDDLVLHAPGECEYCDDYPGYQQLRRTYQIAFSGHDPKNNEFVCPAEVRRSRATINAWGGNVKRPAGTKCGNRRSPDWYCSRDLGHEGPCAAWPVSHRAMSTFPGEGVTDESSRVALREALRPTRRFVLRATRFPAADRDGGAAAGDHGGRADGDGSGPRTFLRLNAVAEALKVWSCVVCCLFGATFLALTFVFGDPVDAAAKAALIATGLATATEAAYWLLRRRPR